jgi:hypothetical protein
MLTFFAHAGEHHDTAIEEAAHTLLAEWYIGLPLLVLVVAGLGAITYLLSRKSKSVTFGVVMMALLIIGFTTYDLSPVVSIVSISAGFAAVLLQVITSLKH